MRSHWFLGLSALLLPQSIAAQDKNPSFYVQCQFNAEADKMLHVFLEVADMGAIGTFDPAKLLDGATFATTELPDFGDGRTYLTFKTAPADGKIWTLILQSRLPREFPREGIEMTDGILARSDEQSPRETGACVNIRSDQAKALFDRAVSSAGAK